MNKPLYVGLDVHKDTIAVCVAEDGRNGEIRVHGIIVNSADAVLRLTKTLAKNGHTPSFWLMKQARVATACIGTWESAASNARSSRPR